MAAALRERMEDRRLRLPVGDAALRADLHSVQRVAGPTGAPRLIAEREGGSHADRFWSLALACSAAAQPRLAYGYEPVGARKWSGRYDPTMDDAPQGAWRDY